MLLEHGNAPRGPSQRLWWSARLAALTIGLLLALPGAAYACPVCFTGNEANRLAYLGTFVFLTVLPLTCIGTLLWWLRKRARELAERQAAEREPGGQEPAAHSA